MTPAGAPTVGSRWTYPAWNNPDYTGPWEVISVGKPGEESMECVELRRVGDDKIHEQDLRFWPGGWKPA